MSKKKDKFVIKLLICGEPGVGKTSLIKPNVHFLQEGHKELLGIDVLNKSVKIPKGTDLLKIIFQIWDITGQTWVTHFRRFYYKNALGVLLVFDLTRPETFEKLDRWREDLREQNPDAKVIVIGNKNDLCNDLPQPRDEILARFQAEDFFSTSITNETESEKVFQRMGQLILGIEPSSVAKDVFKPSIAPKILNSSKQKKFSELKGKKLGVSKLTKKRKSLPKSKDKSKQTLDMQNQDDYSVKLTPIKNLFRQTIKKPISYEAVVAIRNVLEEFIRKISENAAKHAIKDGRKTVTGEDVILRLLQHHHMLTEEISDLRYSMAPVRRVMKKYAKRVSSNAVVLLMQALEHITILIRDEVARNLNDDDLKVKPEHIQKAWYMISSNLKYRKLHPNISREESLSIKNGQHSLKEYMIGGEGEKVDNTEGMKQSFLFFKGTQILNFAYTTDQDHHPIIYQLRKDRAIRVNCNESRVLPSEVTTIILSFKYKRINPDIEYIKQFLKHIKRKNILKIKFIIVEEVAGEKLSLAYELDAFSQNNMLDGHITFIKSEKMNSSLN